jgi:PAS domain S-box-containing protein
MLKWLTEITDYMPHGMCLLWQPWLMGLHIASDALIAAAYFAIPLGIAIFVRRRSDLNVQHRLMAVLFAVFITACGFTHVMSIVTLWAPYYVAEGLIKAVTAVVSIVTALALPFLVPQLLRIPSPKVLAAEVEAHKRTLADLQRAREQLADKVSATEDELRETNRRFEAAISGSPITVFEQDASFRYTWVYNPALGLGVDELTGKTEMELLSPESAAKLQAVKSRALTTAKPQREEVFITRADGGDGRWFDLRVEPLMLRSGQPGIVATSTDITILKRQQDHLQVVMRELNHRSKNLLTIVMSIVRQTARGFDLPSAFVVRLQERLAALASAHDVLATQEWRGADLRSIVLGQLSHQIETYGERITIQGPDLDLTPEAAHYIGMALHELGSNAVKYGALRGDVGAIDISWAHGGAGDIDLVWREFGDPPEPGPIREGFGSRVLRELTPSAVGGRAELVLTASGLHWTLKMPSLGVRMVTLA